MGLKRKRSEFYSDLQKYEDIGYMIHLFKTINYRDERYIYLNNELNQILNKLHIDIINPIITEDYINELIESRHIEECFSIIYLYKHIKDYLWNVPICYFNNS